MNKDKIGKLIVELRKENKLTQEQLAQKLNVERTSVSKWERGANFPDYDQLISLSSFFNLSINEILYGEKATAQNKKDVDNIPLKLCKEINKKSKIIKMVLGCFIITIFAFILFFLSYYFINSYKKIKVYTITGTGKTSELINGIFVQTNNKYYFRIEDFKISDDTINTITLYYLEDNKEKFVTSSDDRIFFIDFVGYNEYFNSNNIDDIVNNLYVRIEYDKAESEDIKLVLVEDYVNSNIFTKNNIPVSNYIDSSFKENDNTDLIKIIKNNFIKKDNGYIFEMIDDKCSDWIFFEESNTLILTTYTNEKKEEIKYEWTYNLEGDILVVSSYLNNNIDFSFSLHKKEVTCMIGNCKNENKLINSFKDNFKKIQ